MARLCLYCAGPLPEGSSRRRRYCRDAHRVEAFKARRMRVARATTALAAADAPADAEARVTAVELLLRQTRAILDGADLGALAARHPSAGEESTLG